VETNLLEIAAIFLIEFTPAQP